MSPHTVWTERALTPVAVPCISKPVISALEIELDARTLSLLDHSVVATWADQSGNANDATGFDNTRRYEQRGWGGDRESVHFQNALQDNFDTPQVQVPFTNALWTVFIVIEPIDISNHLGIYGSDSGATPNNRFIHLFALSDGSLILNRNNAIQYQIQTAPGTIVAGTKYIITAQYAGGFVGMKLRLNGVQVGALATGTGLQSQADYSTPGFGVVFDQTTSGVGRIFGDKRMTWASGYSSAPDDATMLQMEQFLAERFNVPGVTQTTTKPTIPGHEFEYDAITLTSTLSNHDLVTSWPDTSPIGTAATVGDGVPEYEDGAWEGALPNVRLFKPAFGGSFDFNGAPFIGTDLTLFYVFRLWELPDCAFMGGSSFSDFAQVELFVKPAGEITFSFGTSEGPLLAAESAAGAVAADGACHVLTCRHENATGKIIRLDGVEIANNPLAVGNLTSFPTARIGNIANLVGPRDLDLAWVSGHSKGLTLTEMLQMEDYLNCEFCTPATPVPTNIWTQRVVP